MMRNDPQGQMGTCSDQPIRRIDHAHTATYTEQDGRFLVTCPEGCRLGSSADAPSKAKAEARIELHRIATTPLTTPIYPKVKP